MCSINLSKNHLFERTDPINDWGTGKPPRKSIECFGDISKPPAFYLYKCSTKQPYEITQLNLSKNRAHDSLVPSPNHFNAFKSEINCEIPVYHPYSSHIPYFETIPKYENRKGTEGYLLSKENSPKWIINSKIRGNPYREETFTNKEGNRDHAYKQWEPFMMSSKSEKHRNNNYYPSPKKLIRPIDECIFILPDEEKRNKCILELSKSNFTSTYQSDFSQIDSKAQCRLDPIPKTNRIHSSKILDFEINSTKENQITIQNIPINCALFAHFMN